MKKKVVIVGIIGVLFIIGGVIAALFLFNGDTEFTVTFDTTGGSEVLAQQVKKGEKVVKPSDPTREGYTFFEWDLYSEKYDFEKPVGSNMTLRAVWKYIEPTVNTYKVKITIDGKEQVLEINENQKIDFDKVDVEEKSGYDIKWYVDGEEFNALTPVTADMTIEGTYVKTDTYKVKFDSKGGSAVETQNVKAGTKVIEPTDVTYHGYILDGWYLNNKKYDFDTPVTKAITLVAKWKEDPSVKRYTVTFNTDGGSKVASQKVIDGNKATTPTSPTKDGVAFDGWYLNNKKYDFETAVTADITIVAKWRALENYTIKFDTDGGSIISDQVVVEGKKVVKPSDPTKDGYRFKEWTYNNKAYNFDTKVTGNMTLKATWTKKNEVVVTFVSEGSTVATQKVEVGHKLGTLPTSPTKSGYVFTGWYNGSTKYDTNTVINSAVTLTAKFESVDSRNLNTALSNIRNARITIEHGSDNVVNKVTSVSGCTISTVDYPSSIERTQSDKTMAVTFSVTCGSEQANETVNATIKASPYTYNKVANSNMLNYDVTINGGSWPGNAKLFLGTSGSFNVLDRKAVVENAKIESNPTFKMRFDNDRTTIYVVDYRGN